MLKRLTRKLSMLVVLCAALTAVSLTSTSAAGGYCIDAPADSGCNIICCNEWGCYCLF
jgi:hypothetical protein